jgi:hypothetical protein
MFQGELTLPSRTEHAALVSSHVVAAFALCKRFAVKPSDLTPSDIDWVAATTHHCITSYDWLMTGLPVRFTENWDADILVLL